MGCKTHHDLSGALRILLPYVERPSLRCSDESADWDTARETLETPLGSEDTPVRIIPSDPHATERILIKVIEMYVEEKLASRAKKVRCTEKGRMEVGTKLKVLENEVSAVITM